MTNPLAAASARQILQDADASYAMLDRGAGATILLLHGGGGRGTVMGLATALAETARVIAPTHPGFDGAPRVDGVATVADLAALYLQLLDELGLKKVLIVGSSFGGWIASEMILRDPKRIEGLVLIDAVGIEVPGETVVDVFTLPPSQIAQLAFHDPEAIRGRGPAPTAEQQAMQAANLASLKHYDQGLGMQDPALRKRLKSARAPALVIWGESDGVASPSYGRAYAAAFGRGRFELIAQAGHLPQIEQPAKVVELIGRFGLKRS